MHVAVEEIVLEQKQRGFSIVELVATIVILSVLMAVVVANYGQASDQQLQASRDDIIAALLAAQHLAMTKSSDIQIVLGGNKVNVLSNGANLTAGGVAYPIILPNNQTVSSYSFEYNRLGQIKNVPPNTQVLLSQDGSTATINISASGFSQ